MDYRITFPADLRAEAANPITDLEKGDGEELELRRTEGVVKHKYSDVITTLMRLDLIIVLNYLTNISAA